MSQPCFACLEEVDAFAYYNTAAKRWVCKQFESPDDALSWRDLMFKPTPLFGDVYLKFQIHNIKEYPNNFLTRALFSRKHDMIGNVKWPKEEETRSNGLDLINQ